MAKNLQDLIKLLLVDNEKFIDTQSLENLIDVAKYTNEKYRNEESIISDKLYDQIEDEIKKRDPENPFLKKIGEAVTKNKVTLPFFLGSIDKIKTTEIEKLNKWKKRYNKHDYIITDKLDGVSGLFVYNSEKDKKFYTRGDGTTGGEISYLINAIPSLKNLKLKTKIAMRGEIIISKKNFLKYQDKFSNARNLVAGLTNTKKLDLNIMKDVDFIVYEIIEPRLRASEQFELMKKLGIKNCYYEILDKNDLDFEMLDEILIERRQQSEYEIDGIIISDDSLQNVNFEGNPEYSIAFKDSSEKTTADVKVIDVEWNISKDGLIKPVLKITPTKLSGVIISNVTAFNGKFIVDNQIGPGSIVKIIRSGDVIPHILETVKQSKVKMPDVPYEWNKSNVDLIATGAKSTDQIIKELTFFADKLSIANLSEGLITNFVENGIDDIFKIINITKAQLMELDGFKDKLVNKIYDNIQTGLNGATLVQFMNATNIFGHNFGNKRIDKIYSVYGNDFIKFMKSHTIKQIHDAVVAIDGFDEITAKQFSETIHEFIKVFEKIPESVSKNIIKNSEVVKVSEKLKGKKFVFSGFRNKEWEEFIVTNGGEVVGSVSKNTSYLVTTKKDSEEGTSKVLKAKEVGVEIVIKEDFEGKFM